MPPLRHGLRLAFLRRHFPVAGRKFSAARVPERGHQVRACLAGQLLGVQRGQVSWQLLQLQRHGRHPWQLFEKDQEETKEQPIPELLAQIAGIDTMIGTTIVKKIKITDI